PLDRSGHDLVGGRVEVVGELDLDHRAQAVGTHADRRAHNTAFRNGRIKYALSAVFGLQAFGAAEHAAEIADVLTKNHDVIVALQHDVHRRARCLDHGHGRGALTDLMYIRHIYPPSCWR